MRHIQLFAIFCLLVLLVACGGNGSNASSSSTSSSSSSTGSSIPSTGSNTGTIPSVQHFAIVVLENTNYVDAFSSTNMPYFFSLGTSGAVATNYFSDAHPSIGNYFVLTTGLPASVNDSFNGVVSIDNVVREITKAGKTWKEYAESIPSAGYLGGDSGAYLRRHNPFSYLSDVQASQAGNIVPFSQLAADMKNNTLPNYIFITPDATHDAHSCADLTTNCAQTQRLAAADAWLRSNIDPLLKDPNFAASGVLAITFDESADDLTNVGGKVATVFAGTHVHPGYQGTGSYDHRSLLSLSMKSLGVTADINGSNAANQMGEFFQ